MAAAGNIEAQWSIKFGQSVEVSVQGTAGRGGMCANGGRGPGDQSPTLSLLAPELLDCGRCGDGCSGGFVWDAFVTVLNNSECRPLWGAEGGHVLGLSLGLAYFQVAWLAKRTTHSRGRSEPSARLRSTKRWPGSRISSCCRPTSRVRAGWRPRRMWGGGGMTGMDKPGQADRWGYRQRRRNEGGRERDGDNHELRAGETEQAWPDGTSTLRYCPVSGH